MFSEEETELRDMIFHNLENSGFLNKIKAELRAGVFLAIEKDGNLKNEIPLFNKKFDEFVATTEGKLMLSIVRDFLEFFNLQFTLSVFDPEIAIDSPCLSRKEICQQLKLKSHIEGPVISELIKEKLKIQDSKPAANLEPEFKFGSVEISKTVPECTSSKNSSEGEAYDQSNLVNSNPRGETSCVENGKKEFEVDDKIPKRIVTEENLIDKTATVNINNSIFKDANDLSFDHDPFFDLPLPSEKTSSFTFTENLKDKSEDKLVASIVNPVDKKAQSGLSSLKDLPSLSTNNEWSFSRDDKQAFLNLESQKSVSNSETSNEEIINLDVKDNFQKKDSDIAESNDSSEKPNSEDSIEEEIEEEFSAGLEDLLNSSLSLADDVTTDQTISQTSVVEGVDHVEPCK